MFRVPQSHAKLREAVITSRSLHAFLGVPLWWPRAVKEAWLHDSIAAGALQPFGKYAVAEGDADEEAEEKPKAKAPAQGKRAKDDEDEDDDDDDGEDDEGDEDDEGGEKKAPKKDASDKARAAAGAGTWTITAGSDGTQTFPLLPSPTRLPSPAMYLVPGFVLLPDDVACALPVYYTAPHCLSLLVPFGLNPPSFLPTPRIPPPPSPPPHVHTFSLVMARGQNTQTTCAEREERGTIPLDSRRLPRARSRTLSPSARFPAADSWSAPASKTLRGVTVCFTGKGSRPRSQLEALAKKHGAATASSCTKVVRMREWGGREGGAGGGKEEGEGL